MVHLVERHTSVAPGPRRTRSFAGLVRPLKGQLLRCRIFAIQDIKKAQKLAEDLTRICQEFNYPLIHIDALLVHVSADHVLAHPAG